MPRNGIASHVSISLELKSKTSSVWTSVSTNCSIVFRSKNSVSIYLTPTDCPTFGGEYFEGIDQHVPIALARVLPSKTKNTTQSISIKEIWIVCYQVLWLACSSVFLWYKQILTWSRRKLWQTNCCSALLPLKIRDKYNHRISVCPTEYSQHEPQSSVLRRSVSGYIICKTLKNRFSATKPPFWTLLRLQALGVLNYFLPLNDRTCLGPWHSAFVLLFHPLFIINANYYHRLEFFLNYTTDYFITFLFHCIFWVNDRLIVQHISLYLYWLQLKVN